jgi:hypothetical protein
MSRQVLQYEFICDGCDKHEPARMIDVKGELPCVWKSKPVHWVRSYGYDLCSNCGHEYAVRTQANRMFNEAIHRVYKQRDSEEYRDTYHGIFTALWDNCRAKSYGHIHVLVCELRKAHGLPPNEHAVMMSERWNKWKSSPPPNQESQPTNTPLVSESEAKESVSESQGDKAGGTQ